MDNVRSNLASVITHLVFDGVADGALGVGLDVVGTAARLVQAGLVPEARRAKPLRQRVASVDGEAVRSGTGRAVAVDGAFSLRGVGAGDVVVVPGLSAATEHAVERLLSRAVVTRGAELLSRASERGALIAASCSATFVLAASGLLAGRSATTTWWLVPVFARRFPEVSLCAERMVVESDGVLTAGSAFAHADLMLGIVARVAGPSLAHLVARYLVLDERASQARYMVIDHLRTSDPALRAVERFVAANVSRQLTLDELAKAAGTSTRTLARRAQAAVGMTPIEFVQRVRVAHASHLLETTQASVEEVAARVGYADAAAFRRVFRRHAGETPRGRRAAS